MLSVRGVQYDLNEEINIRQIDYGSCTHQRKLYELTHYFSSTIWASYQGFLQCFGESLPLNKQDVELILEYDRLFQEWEKLNW